MRKFVIIFDSNLLLSTGTNINDTNKLVKFFNDNYTILWLEKCVKPLSYDITYTLIYTSFEDGKKKLQNIKFDLRKQKDIISCPFLVIDFERNRELYWGYDYFLDIDSSLRLSYNVSIVDFGNLLYRMSLLENKWYGERPNEMFDLCASNYYTAITKSLQQKQQKQQKSKKRKMLKLGEFGKYKKNIDRRELMSTNDGNNVDYELFDNYNNDNDDDDDDDTDNGDGDENKRALVLYKKKKKKKRI